MAHKDMDKLTVRAKALREGGLSYQKIADRLGIKNKSTVRYWLIPAVREKAQTWRKKNREHIRDWREKHREELREKRRKDHIANSEKYKARAKQWREENPERTRETKTRYHATHKTEERKYRIEHKDVRRAYARLRQGKIKEYDKISQKEYDAIFKRQKGLCVYCSRKMRTTGDPRHPLYKTQEHIYPVSRGGAHSLDNLAYACRECNISKNARTVAEWKPELLDKIGNGVRSKK